MRSLTDIRANTPKTEIFRGQIQHTMLAALLTIGACSLLRDNSGSFLGVSTMTWSYIAIALALIHQSIVAVVFRLQLHFNLMVRIFGSAALKVWGFIFLPLLGVRPILLIIVGICDYGSLGGNRMLQMFAGMLLMGLIGWAMHSVLKYFTINRALGGDHFYDEYLNMPMVNQGAFKYSGNAMYTFIFSGLWGIGLLLGSWNALVLALFYHAYIWVHMYCTEDPDMQVLYRSS
ncbi:MAG: methyltransferase [Paracoccaceae bacterium]